MWWGGGDAGRWLRAGWLAGWLAIILFLEQTFVRIDPTWFSQRPAPPLPERTGKECPLPSVRLPLLLFFLEVVSGVPARLHTHDARTGRRSAVHALQTGGYATEAPRRRPERPSVSSLAFSLSLRVSPSLPERLPPLSVTHPPALTAKSDQSRPADSPQRCIGQPAETKTHSGERAAFGRRGTHSGVGARGERTESQNTRIRAACVLGVPGWQERNLATRALGDGEREREAATFG